MDDLEQDEICPSCGKWVERFTSGCVDSFETMADDMRDREIEREIDER